MEKMCVSEVPWGRTGNVRWGPDTWHTPGNLSFSPGLLIYLYITLHLLFCLMYIYFCASMRTLACAPPLCFGTCVSSGISLGTSLPIFSLCTYILLCRSATLCHLTAVYFEMVYGDLWRTVQRARISGMVWGPWGNCHVILLLDCDSCTWGIDWH